MLHIWIVQMILPTSLRRLTIHGGRWLYWIIALTKSKRSHPSKSTATRTWKTSTWIGCVLGTTTRRTGNLKETTICFTLQKGWRIGTEKCGLEIHLRLRPFTPSANAWPQETSGKIQTLNSPIGLISHSSQTPTMKGSMRWSLSWLKNSLLMLSWLED